MKRETLITHRQHLIARLLSDFGGDAARGDGGDLATFADYTPQIGLIFHKRAPANNSAFSD